MSRFREPASHLSRSVGERHRGTGGILNSLMTGVRVSQTVSDHRGCLGRGTRVGGARTIVISTWSEPVERREPFQPPTMGRTWGFAKDRSITEGRALPGRGNLVYSPGGLRRAKPASAAFSKYGVEDNISRGESDCSGSERPLCMLKSPTTQRGTSRDGKRVSGETEWTRWSHVLVE